MRKLITKVVAWVLCLAMIACWIPRFEIPAFAASEYPNTHVNTGNMAADIVAVAVSQAGYCEGSLSGNPAYASSNNYQKYGQWYDANVDNIGVTYAAWCAAFVSWCANQAGVPSSVVYYHAYCPYGVNWFRNQGRFQYAASRGGSYVPNPGDIVYFAPSGSSTSSHVGIVRYAADGYVYTVEGNTSGQNGEVNEGGGVFLKRYSLSYSRLYGYGIPAYVDNSGKNPVGQIDGVTAEGPGKIRVRGWTLDEDELGTSLEAHIYVGGGPGDPNAEGYVVMANQPRDDVAAAYPWAGNAHGFDVVLNTGKSGWQVVNVFGINVGRGGNTLLTNSGWIVDVPADTENPTISDVQVSNVTSLGYTVTCTVSDNVAIRNVTMPTWTVSGGQDDITWDSATVSGNTATLNVSFSSHNFEFGTYSTHIYAYDLAGNSNMYPVSVDIPAVLVDKPVSGTVEENTYFIANAVNKNYVADVSNISTENGANIQLWWTLGSSTNQMWKISDPDGDGYYTIVSVNSGKAMEAAAGGTTDGTNVQQYELNGTDAQLWKLEENADGTYRIINKNSGLSLDLDSGILTSGQNIRLYSANDTGAQKWYLIPADLAGPQITNVEFSEISSAGFRVTCTVDDISGIQKVEFPAWTQYNGGDDLVWHAATVTGNTATCYISIADHNFEPGDYDVHIYAYDSLGNSHGIVTSDGVTVPNRIGSAPVSGKPADGAYYIANVQNQNFVLDVSAASQDNSANVQLWETIGLNRNQMWQLSDPDGDGYYTAVAVHSGKYLDVDGGVAASGTNVQQYEATNSDAQLWQIVPNDDGTYCFYSKCGGFALDLFFGAVSNGSNISIQDVNGSAAQKWYLIPADAAGPGISNVEFSEISTEGFRVTCTVEDPSGLQKVEFPAWTTSNGNDDLIWHAATITGNTASCYISIGDHNLEPGDYEVHIYAHDLAGNWTGVVPNSGVTVPNRIGNAPVSGKLENGTYFITNAQNQNFAVEVAGASMDNSANVQLWETLGINTNHMWQITDPDGDGYYTAVALHSGKYLDVEAGSSANDTNVQQYEATNSAAQFWQIVPNDDGTYCFYSMCGGLALDLFYGWVINGSNVRIHEVNGAEAQKWYLIPAKLSADTSHIHTYLNPVVTEPTCTEAGYTTHTCANCGDSYVTDETAALGHRYVNGGCTVCGEGDPDYDAVVVPTLTLKYPTLLIEDEVILAAYFTIDDTTSVEEIGMLTWSAAPTTVSIDTAENVLPNGAYHEATGYYWAQSQGIPAKEMGDEIYLCVYVKLTDGTYCYSKQVSYSAKAYCYNQLTSSNGAMKPLLVALLNYGAAAQNLFSYKTDAPVNAGLTDAQKALIVDYSSDMVSGVPAVTAAQLGDFAATGSGFSRRYPTVSFQGAFSIGYNFVPDRAVSGDLKLYVWQQAVVDSGAVLTAENAVDVITMSCDGSQYTAFVNDIAAKDLDDGVYVAGVYTDADGSTHSTGVLGYSVSAYCKSMVNDASSGAIAEAIAVYGYYAKLAFER